MSPRLSGGGVPFGTSPFPGFYPIKSQTQIFNLDVVCCTAPYWLYVLVPQI